jgi:hypothetical protein
VNGECGAFVWAAGDGDRTTERFDAIGQAEDAGTASGVDAADAVVEDLECQSPAVVRRAQPDDVGVGVLGDVGESLGGDVVGRCFDGRGEPFVEPDVDVDRDVGTTGERSEC